MPTYVVRQWLQKHEEEGGKDRALTGSRGGALSFTSMVANRGGRNSWLNYFPFYDYEKDPTVLLLETGGTSDTRFFYYEGETGQVAIALGRAVAVSALGLERRPLGDTPWSTMSACDSADPESVTVLIWGDRNMLRKGQRQDGQSSFQKNGGRKMRSSSSYNAPPNNDRSQSGGQGPREREEKAGGRESREDMIRESLCNSSFGHFHSTEGDTGGGCWVTIQTFEIPCVTRKRVQLFPLARPASLQNQGLTRDSSYLQSLQKNMETLLLVTQQNRDHPPTPYQHSSPTAVSSEDNESSGEISTQKRQICFSSAPSTPTGEEKDQHLSVYAEKPETRKECAACKIPVDECIVTDKVKLVFKSRPRAPYTRLYRIRVFGCDATASSSSSISTSSSSGPEHLVRD